MKEWFICKELAGLPGLPGTERGVQKLAERSSWQFRTRAGRGGGREYHLSMLPDEARIALAGQSITLPAAIPAKLGLQAAKQHAEEKERERIRRERQLARFGGLPQEKQEQAFERLQLLDACRDFIRAAKIKNKKQGMAQFCRIYNSGEITAAPETRQVVPSVSVPTLLRWRRSYEEQGLIGLVNGYANPKKGTTSLTPEQQEFCIGLLVSKPHLSYSGINMAVAARFPYPPHSSSVRRFVSRWKEENASLLLFCTNPDAWRSKHQFAVGDADQHVDRLNQVWEFDSTPADVMLADGRHSLIGVIDVFTRRLKLLVSKTSRATAVAGLIRAALLDWGVPEFAKTDNGADYVSKHIVGVFSALQVEQILCPPFTPEAKPHIERAFKTFAHSFQEMMPNFIGHSVAQRKDIESRRSFAERLGQLDGVVEIKMTAAELQRYCDRWCEAIYHQNVHRSLDNSTPAQVARIWRGTEKRIEDVRALDILLAEAPDNNGFRVVGKKGVRVDKIEYISAELAGLEGKSVRVKLDPADLGTIYLFDADGTFLCVAQDPLRTGIDRAEVAARLNHLQKEKMGAAKKEAKRIAKQQAVEQIHEEILLHREQQIANIIELPKPSIPYSTPALNEAGRAVEAMQRNQRELDEIDEMIADADLGPIPTETGNAATTRQMEAEAAPPDAQKVIPIFATMSDRYNWIKHRERSAAGLTQQEYEWLSEYYTTTGGRMYLQLEGDLRKRMGLRQEAQRNGEA